jgi:dihydrofolate reductase
MKKLIVSNWISLDGYISGPDGALDWILGDGRLAQYETELMQQVDTTLFGRRTYEQLSTYWSAVPDSPQAMDWEKPYAQMINAAHHIVVSHNLKDATWGTATIWRDLDAKAVAALKAGSGKSILMFGSASIVQELTRLGLIDEYQLLIHPVLLGGGTRLFDGIDTRTRLKRVDVEAFDSGIVKTVFQPA